MNFLYSFGFQDAATPIMEGIVDLHNHIMFYLVLDFSICFIYICKYIVRFL